VASLVFHKKPNANQYRGVHGNQYWPRELTTEGKEQIAEIQDLLTVSKAELNEAVGFYDDKKKIGVNLTEGKKYYGFSVGNDWDYTPCEDCIEITYTEYKNL